MLDKKYNFLESEKKWQKFWLEEGVYKFNKGSNKPLYSIDTPPPTASGHIHLGHIFSYSQAEFIARYKRMTGFNVFYPFGYDNNGLPTERLVEKETGIKANSLPREEFNKICLATVDKYEKFYKDTYVRAGNSADWSLCYSTISAEVQKTAQQSFLDLYKKNKLYFAYKDAIWCSECQTTIAQAELESKDMPTTFNYMKWQVKGSAETIEIATTRPELLAACVCVFVHPSDKRYKNLVGKKVIVPLYNFEVEILTDKDVSPDKGSGAVMCCTFGDQTDAAWYFRHNLPRKEALNDYGRMTELAGKYAGMKVKQAREAIIADLKEAGIIFKQDELTHAVAVHERCGLPMEITLKKQWFVKILEAKDELLKKGDEVEWYPEFRKSAYTDWVKNLERDWCISRQRYYGIPIPVWYCKDCGEILVADEKDLPVNPLKTAPKTKCKCGCAEFVPEADVFDTWFTSSLTPQINCKWNLDDATYKKMMPMDLRPNAREIIRTWDFYTIVKSLYHDGARPWKNVMISGWAMADKNEKISKSKGNSKFDVDYAFSTYSADVVRYWATTGGLGRDIVVADEGFTAGVRLMTKLWNASKFALTFLEGYKPRDIKLYPMDEWIILGYNKMLAEFNALMEKYEIGYAREVLEKFFWNFCDNYIEIAKNRLYKPEIYGKQAKESGQYALLYVLFGILKCFAIYMPHVTEEIYQSELKGFFNEKSIHICEIAAVDYNCSLQNFEVGNKVCEIVAAVRQFKSENNLSLKDELSKVELSGFGEFDKLVADDLKAVCGIRDLAVVGTGEKGVKITK